MWTRLCVAMLDDQSPRGRCEGTRITFSRAMRRSHVLWIKMPDALSHVSSMHSFSFRLSVEKNFICFRLFRRVCMSLLSCHSHLLNSLPTVRKRYMPCTLCMIVSEVRKHSMEGPTRDKFWKYGTFMCCTDPLVSCKVSLCPCLAICELSKLLKMEKTHNGWKNYCRACCATSFCGCCRYSEPFLSRCCLPIFLSLYFIHLLESVLGLALIFFHSTPWKIFP